MYEQVSGDDTRCQSEARSPPRLFEVRPVGLWWPGEAATPSNRTRLTHMYERVPYLLSGGSGLRSFHAKVRDGVQRHSLKPSVKEIKRANCMLDKDGKLLFRGMYLREYNM